MPRLIDADKAYKVLTDYYHQRTEIQHKALKEAFERVPTVDAEPVVRCKDCIRYAPFKDIDGVCLAHNKGALIVMSQNGYCNLGERREDVKTD